MRWAALLKGVNVGGNRKLPMADLRKFVEGLGFIDVKTLLASGNVVFDAEEKDAAKLEKKLETAAAKELGLNTDFLLRSAVDLKKIIAANPFPDAAKDHPNHLMVVFYRDPFDAALLKALDHDGPERLAAKGRELFIDYPDDIGHSTLHKATARAKFPKLATARNWNTVNKLAALLD